MLIVLLINFVSLNKFMSNLEMIFLFCFGYDDIDTKFLPLYNSN